MKTKYILISIVAVLLIGALFVLFRNDTPEPVTPPTDTTNGETATTTDEHLVIDETLRDVNFCGITYQVKQVKIDGVDVVQRIAELATENKIPAYFERGPNIEPGTQRMIDKKLVIQSICGHAQGGTIDGNIQVKFEGVFSGNDIGLPTEQIYIISTPEPFIISTPSGNIYMTDGFSGTPMGPIGKLK